MNSSWWKCFLLPQADFQPSLPLGLKSLFCVQGWKELGGFYLRGECGAWAHPGCRKAAQRLSPVWEGEREGEGGGIPFLQPLLWDPCSFLDIHAAGERRKLSHLCAATWMDMLEFPALKLLGKGNPGRAGGSQEAHMETQKFLGHSSEQEELFQLSLVLLCSGHTGVF